MEDMISRREHEEFCRRMETENGRITDENARQNKRLELLEDTTRQINALVTSVERLATNMENMLKSQEAHNDRLEALEGRDGEMWRKVSGYIITAVAGIVIGYMFKMIGF